jgi:hypothetical protein
MANQQSRTGAARPRPEVYRRRRTLAAVLAVLVVGLLVWGIVALAGLFAGDGDPAATGGSSPAAAAPSSESAAPPSGPSPSGAPESASPSGASGPECAAGDIAVSADTDKGSYGANEDPVLVMSIQNTSGSDCSVNVGTTQQEFTVVSGSDRIFSTTDCLADATDVHVSIAAGEEETARFTWERLRSAPGCQSVAANPRPGTYVFTAKLGDVSSNRATFSLQ